MRSLSWALQNYHHLTPSNPSISGAYDRPNIARNPAKTSDPNWPLQLRADIDRQIAAMPDRPGQIFHLLYRHQPVRGRDWPQDQDPRLQAQEVAYELGIRRMDDYQQIYWHWYGVMRRALSDWFGA